MELHLVHREVNGSGLLVQAFFFMIGGDESGLLNIINYTKVANKKDAHQDINAKFNPMELIHMVNQDTDGFYSYNGSLTTPPCSEGVKWILWRKSLVMTKLQWEGFAKSVTVHFKYSSDKGNYRPAQNLNSRTVKLRYYRAKATEIKNGYQIQSYLLILLFVLTQVYIIHLYFFKGETKKRFD